MKLLITLPADAKEQAGRLKLHGRSLSDRKHEDPSEEKALRAHELLRLLSADPSNLRLLTLCSWFDVAEDQRRKPRDIWDESGDRRRILV